MRCVARLKAGAGKVWDTKPTLHYEQTFAHMGDHREIMADKNLASAALGPQPVKQVRHLGPDRKCGFIGGR